MKHILPAVFAFFFAAQFSLAQNSYCDSTGNVVIFSNYDGGILNINVDVDIPNLKIGITTYEAAQINISGTYASNVTEVVYAGYIGTNDNCGLGVTSVSINGAGTATTNILQYPAATISNPNGYNYIICAYSCDINTNQGGCNTVDQISGFFLNHFGGSLLMHQTNYNCWQPAVTRNISSGGNCCITPPLPPNANFTASNTTICAGDCIDFTDLSANTPTMWNWSFPGASTTTSGNQDPSGICYPTAGSYTVTLTAGNGQGSSTHTMNITVNANPSTPVITQNVGVLSTSGGISYQWFLNGNPISGANASSYTPTSNGSYTVEISDANGCTSVSSAFAFNSLSVDENSWNEITLQPNPSQGSFKISGCKNLLPEKITILSREGKLVYSKSIQSESDLTISNFNLSPGVYFVAMKFESGNAVKKLLITE